MEDGKGPAIGLIPACGVVPGKCVKRAQPVSCLDELNQAGNVAVLLGLRVSEREMENQKYFALAEFLLGEKQTKFSGVSSPSIHRGQVGMGGIVSERRGRPTVQYIKIRLLLSMYPIRFGCSSLFLVVFSNSVSPMFTCSGY